MTDKEEKYFISQFYLKKADGTYQLVDLAANSIDIEWDIK